MNSELDRVPLQEPQILTIERDNFEGEVCSICLQELEEIYHGDVCELSCHHYLCRSCLESLVSTRETPHPLCPLCREPIMSYMFSGTLHMIRPLQRASTIAPRDTRLRPPPNMYLMNRKNVHLLQMFGLLSMVSMSLSMLNWYRCIGCHVCYDQMFS